MRTAGFSTADWPDEMKLTEAASLIDVPYNTMRNWVKAGKIRACDLLGPITVDKDEVLRIIDTVLLRRGTLSDCTLLQLNEAMPVIADFLEIPAARVEDACNEMQRLRYLMVAPLDGSELSRYANQYGLPAPLEARLYLSPEAPSETLPRLIRRFLLGRTELICYGCGGIVSQLLAESMPDDVGWRTCEPPYAVSFVVYQRRARCIACGQVAYALAWRDRP